MSDCQAPSRVEVKRGPAAARRQTARRVAPPRESPLAEGRVPLTSDQQQLAADYVPLAKSLAKPLKRSWPVEGDDFVSVALVALVEAAQSFDPSRNVKFATFARYRIWGALRDMKRALIIAGWRGDLGNAPKVSSLCDDSEEKGSVYGSEPDAPVGSELEGIDFVEGWLRKLPADHASACREIFLNGRSQGAAARRLRCSKSRVSYLREESIEMLKDAFADEEWLAKKKRSPV